MHDTPIDVETVKSLSRLQGLTVPDEDLEPLATALASHIAATLRVLELYGDSEFEPSPIFDPRWE